MNKEVEIAFVEAMSHAPIEMLFNDIPSKIAMFHLDNRGEREPLVEYLGLIKEELTSRCNVHDEEYLSNCLSKRFCTRKLFPRWIDAFEAGGLEVFNVLAEVGLLNIVIVQLSAAFDCEKDINSVIAELFNRGILLGIVTYKKTQSTNILRSM